MKKFVLSIIILGLVVSLISLTACKKEGKSEPVELLGAGATFPQPLYIKWFDYYYTKTNGLVKVNYQGIGSGGGIQQLIEKVVDFGASDAPMNEDEEKRAGAEVIHIPVALGAVVVTYNLPNNPKLKLTGDVVADIFMGKITKWNDPRIQSLNPEVTLPNLDITVAHRSDGSGTTYVFSDYLSKVSESWKKEMGVGKSLNWKVGLGGKGNPGVAGIVQQTLGAIGYVELIYAEQNGMQYAMIKNKSGKFVDANLKSISASANVSLPKHTKVSITDTDNPDGYPISSFTWIIVYKEQNYGGRNYNRVKALVELLKWMNSEEAQEINEQLLYAKIPEAVRKINVENIKSITFDGKEVK
ncbi:MAG: phosphate ABC transporter substrate-binding protein PstS [Caldisericia bacterium]|jgi:phosphate transport system substrate-binding protein|nr:phosphate ABC transporter substrate-binding protein PstS [Caldisericia bacterium]